MSEEVSRTRESYDALAATYTERIFTELAGKPLDGHLLNRFAEDVRDRGLVCDLGSGPATWLVISTSAASGCWASISRPG